MVELRNSVQNGPNWCKSSCHEVTSEFFATNSRDPSHWTLNTCFGAFRTICCLMKLGAKRAELVQKFVPQSRVRIFRNQCTQSTPLDPKHMFWCVLYNFGAFGTIWLTYETRCKTGRAGTNVRGTKSHRNFSKRTHPICSIGP